VIRIDRIHLNDDYCIYVELLEIFESSIKMQYNLTQKKYVERQISLVSRLFVVSIKVRTIRVEDLKLESLTTNNELFENENAKDLKIEITKNILIESIRVEKRKQITIKSNHLETF
jgi:hypothetical protein